MNVITRFPPSPTGFMHIGTARTALFNWLYAKRHTGKMLFRIEDTDRARHSQDAVDAMIKAMEWLGLDWDGDIVSQYARRERHTEIAHELLAAGKAYKCYCSPAELDEMREKARTQGKPTFYDRRWRDKNESAAPPDIEPVIRIKAPLDGDSVLQDRVQGKVTLKNEQLDDFIILRSDGTPTYMLAVVVDDHEMGVTHVIRGDDHLNNTFRQNIIYDALGWGQPEYAHIPLILGPDGAKMSKRHGAASVEDYQKMGYLPEAMRNYLLRLGWSHGDDEIISTDQAIKWFDLDHIGKSASRFDFEKLEHVNAHYINEADPARLIELCAPFYAQRHNGLEVSDMGKARILAGAQELQSRAKTLIQFADESAFYAKSLPFSYDEKAASMIGPDNKEILQALYEAFSALDTLTNENVQETCKNIATTMCEGKLGKVAMPLRAALCGTTVSPSIFQATEILGKEESCARLKAALTV